MVYLDDLAGLGGGLAGLVLGHVDHVLDVLGFSIVSPAEVQQFFAPEHFELGGTDDDHELGEREASQLCPAEEGEVFVHHVLVLGVIADGGYELLHAPIALFQRAHGVAGLDDGPDSGDFCLRV